MTFCETKNMLARSNYQHIAEFSCENNRYGNEMVMIILLELNTAQEWNSMFSQKYICGKAWRMHPYTSKSNLLLNVIN